jgi:hypothetical protein
MWSRNFVNEGGPGLLGGVAPKTKTKKKQNKDLLHLENTVFVKCFVPTFKPALIFMLTSYRNTTSVHMLLHVPCLYLNPIECHALLFLASAFRKKKCLHVISGIDRVCDVALSSYIHWKLLQNPLLFIEISQHSYFLFVTVTDMTETGCFRNRSMVVCCV